MLLVLLVGLIVAGLATIVQDQGHAVRWVEQPASVLQTSLLLGGTAALTILLALVLFVAYVVRTVVVPLRRGSSALRSLADGEWEVRLPEHGASEVRLLASAFNQAASSLAQRQAELRDLAAELQDTVTLHESVIRTAHHAHVAMDGRGIIASWNPSAERIFGWAAAEAIGQPLGELIVPEGRLDACLAGLKRHLETGTATLLGTPIELSATRRDGTEFPIEMTIARIDRREGPYFHAFIADTTSRHQAEGDRRLLAMVAESTADAVITIDTDMRITSFNAGAEAVYGHRAQDVIGGSILELNAPGPDREVARDLVERLLAGEELRDRMVPRRRRDGTRIYLDLSSSPLRDDSGRIVGGASILRDVTEIQRMSVELAESEARFRKMFEEAPIGIALVSLDGFWLRINETACEMLGYGAEELLGVSFQEITHPDDLDADLQYVSQVLDGERRAYQMDKRYFRKDGEIVWVRLSVSLVRDSVNRPLYFVSHIEDVTAQRAAERDREHALRLFDEAQQISHVGSWSWNTIADAGTWSAEMYRIFGRDPEAGAATGEEFFAYVHPEDRAEVARGYEQVFGGGPSFELDYRINAGDGAERVLHARAREDPSQPGCYAGTAQDVTALRAAERKIRAAEQRLRTMFEYAPIGKALMSPDGRIEQINAAFGALCGRTRDELRDVRLRELLHPGDIGRAMGAIRQLAAGESDELALELRFMSTSGSPVDVSVTGRLLPDADGYPANILCQFQDISERKHFEEQLQFMADHDPLTGLLNRRKFEAELERHVAHVKRYGSRGALVVLDIDNFKRVNDTLGHSAGDELIVSVAGVLRNRLRESDVLARLGGDEFAILLPNVDQTDGERVAASLVEAVKANTTLLNGEHHRVTTSIGIATFEASEDLSGEATLINADLAMYDAKEAGKDGFALYSTSEYRASRTEARLTWVRRIEQALETDRFVLAAQPILDLHTGTIRQHELLIRMLDDHDEEVPPATFLYIAERFGLIRRIDEWVSARAIELIEHDPDLQLEINISGRSLGDPALLAAIERRLRDSPIDPTRLIFEVTETSAVANVTHAQAFAQRLRDLGCRFALDDFGAGFGSFYYLKHLPFDYIKIDGEFVQHAVSGQIDQLVIEAVVRVAQGLGKETIAEFVTDERTQRMVKRLGVDYAQGYHVGRPVPVAEICAATLERPGQLASTGRGDVRRDLTRGSMAQ